jgi:hypothetical protein
MSRRLCLIWLLLALLPLRGWAVATMAAPSVTAMAAVQRADGAGPALVSVMPCHEAPVGNGDASSAGQACTLCDLCHNLVTLHSVALPAGSAAPTTAPRPGAARDTGRHAVGGLERPPRPDLA